MITEQHYLRDTVYQLRQKLEGNGMERKIFRQLLFILTRIVGWATTPKREERKTAVPASYLSPRI